MVDIKSLIETVQEKTGITEAKAKQMLGAFFSFAKQHGIPVPSQAQKLVEDAESENQTAKDSGEHASLLDSAVGFLGSMNADDTKSRAAETTADSSSGASTSTSNGGEVDSLTELLALLKKFGIDPQQVMSALPAILKFLKDQGIDISSIVNKIPGGSAALGGSGTAAASSTGEGTKDTADSTEEMVSDVKNMASGFLRSFGK
jgi:hypothetical protein